MMLIFCASTIMLLIAPFSPAFGIGSIGFASAFTTAITATSSQSLNGKSTTQRQASDAAATTATEDEKKIWTLQQLEDYASDESINVVISFTTFGPAFRTVARAAHDESIVLGYGEGFLRPAQPKLLHLDKMEIYQPVVKRVRRTHPNTLNFGGVNIGLGLVIGYRCMLFAADPANGPRTTAEFLAIDDEEFQHKRLVRYYKSTGFKIVKYVGEDIKDIPDRMMWGGCGTLMRTDIPELMAKWTSLFELMKSRVEKKKEKEEEAKRSNPVISSESESDNDETN